MVFGPSNSHDLHAFVDASVFPPLFDPTAIDLLEADEIDGPLLDEWGQLIESLQQCRSTLTLTDRRADSESIRSHSIAFSYPEEMSIRNVQVMQDIDPDTALQVGFTNICRTTSDWSTDETLDACTITYLFASTVRFCTKREIGHEDGKTVAFVGVPESLLNWCLRADRIHSALYGELDVDDELVRRWVSQLCSNTDRVIREAKNADMFLPVVGDLHDDATPSASVRQYSDSLSRHPRVVHQYCLSRLVD